MISTGTLNEWCAAPGRAPDVRGSSCKVLMIEWKEHIVK